MTTDGEQVSSTDDDSTSPTSSRTGRALRDIASDIWRTKPAGTPAGSTKAIVDGLDRRELTIALAGTTFDLFITIVLYFTWRHNVNVTFRRDADSLLYAGMIGTALMALGTAFRRRALLGFAAFIAGFEMISFGQIQGVLYLGFGGWLIIRALRRQKQSRPAAPSTTTRRSTALASPASAPRKSSGLPKASKRYTPPRRVRSSADKRQ